MKVVSFFLTLVGMVCAVYGLHLTYQGNIHTIPGYMSPIAQKETYDGLNLLAAAALFNAGAIVLLVVSGGKKPRE